MVCRGCCEDSKSGRPRSIFVEGRFCGKSYHVTRLLLRTFGLSRKSCWDAEFPFWFLNSSNRSDLPALLPSSPKAIRPESPFASSRDPPTRYDHVGTRLCSAGCKRDFYAIDVQYHPQRRLRRFHPREQLPVDRRQSVRSSSWVTTSPRTSAPGRQGTS